jgi:hypothetical protein
MSPDLLDHDEIPRRTLSHDMESFFAVIIWIATLNYDDDVFQSKPLADVLNRNIAPRYIVTAKGYWFKQRKAFRKSIINHFEKPYLEDREFLTCLYELRKILYVDEDESDEDSQAILFGNFDIKDDDLMKEGVFRRCMELIDDYLDQTKGIDEMDWIDRNRRA